MNNFLNFIHVSDKLFLQINFYKHFHRFINFNNPKTFNEKIQWLKIYDRNNNYSKLVDKYEVKKIVSQKIGKEYFIPTLGVYDKFDDIDFDKLPDRFVIKCTHDSGGIVICSDKSKLDFNQAKNKIEKALGNNYYYHGREWPYKNVVPRIIVEEYMEDIHSPELIDYKFMCFNGKVKSIFTCTERYSGGLKVTFFDLNWKKQPFERHYPASKKNISKPKNFNKMVELSEKLAKDIPFVRIDWYEINGKLYFGEYTFYPGNGLEEFTPEEWDYKLGEWLKLPIKEGNNDEKDK